MLKLLLVCVVSGICVINADETDPVVCLEKGCVRGKAFKGNIKEFEGFLGIPYAKVPIGELRLKVSLTKLQNCTTKRKKTLFMVIYASRVKLKKVSFNKGSSANHGKMERNLQRIWRKNALHAEKLFDTKSNGYRGWGLPLSLCVSWYKYSLFFNLIQCLSIYIFIQIPTKGEIFFLLVFANISIRI